MMPRPRSRKREIEYRDPEDLADEIRACRREQGDPAAVISAPKEWRLMADQPGARPYVRSWPSGDVTFDSVPVILRRDLGAPTMLATQQDLEDALLGAD